MDYTNERGVVKRVQFHSSGLPSTIIRALGKPEQQSTTFVRNAATNLVESRTDSLGRVTAYQYDSKGNLTQVTHLSGTPNATTWTYTYEPRFSTVTSVTDPLNHTTTYNYDVVGHLTSVVDALGHTTSLTYTGGGQLATMSRNLGSSALTTAYEWNGGDLASVTDPLNRTTRFFVDRVGRVVSMKDAAGNMRRISYDLRDLVTQTTDGLGHTTQRTYDGSDNMLTFTDERNNTTQFGYDLRDRLSSKTDPLNETESYLYDDIGNLIRVTDRKGQVTGYGYDFLDRRTSAGFGAMTSSPTSFISTISYAWDAGNRMTDAIDSVSGTIHRSFDGLNRLLQEQSAQGQIDYTYFANGLRQTMTVQGRPSVSYTYDSADRLSQISQGSANVGFAYDAIDRRTTLTLPSGIAVTYGYDDASQLTSLTYKLGSATLGNLMYGYDAADRRTSVGGSFAHVNLPAAVTTATHDAANRLTQWGARTLGYDDNGALITDTDSATLSYVWDERQRLKQIKDGATTVASFQYDALNRRIAKTIAGTTTSFLNDGWQVVQELNGGVPAANLLTGLRTDEIFRRSAGTTTEDFLADALGSTIALANGSGAIETAYRYEPYGATISDGVSSSNMYQFTGRENDGGLYYYRNRYYSPALHRFIGQDPIGLAGGSNLYAYVRGNPIGFVDPFGLEGETEEEAPKDDPSKMSLAERTQLACDAAGEWEQREREADEFRREGNWDKYYDRMKQADESMKRWQRYTDLHNPITTPRPPRGPSPPSNPPPGVSEPPITAPPGDVVSGPMPPLRQ
jgi:RHS repeat-associated protein